jgi:hypothetical protein
MFKPQKTPPPEGTADFRAWKWAMGASEWELIWFAREIGNRDPFLFDEVVEQMRRLQGVS